ncbi:hypothetical protein NM688_g2290 [Phlebia brevispora]|uniref:Uncharacterized protein n=1 Tax=Phlebia brevispora TaxID=194682 RepID=A0ACC1T8P7_9APHY|nr:hypothetical protein NM688_g2290 [Phlebia brevispora]
MLPTISLLILLSAFVATNASAVYSSVESSTPESASVVTSTYTGTKVINTILTVEPFLALDTETIIWKETYTLVPTSVASYTN